MREREFAYLYLSDGPIRREDLKSALSSLGIDYRLDVESPSSGIVYAASSLFPLLESSMMAFREDLGCNIAFLRSHRDTPLSRKLVREGLSYFPNCAFFPCDVLMREFFYQDFSSLPLLRAEFSGLDQETYRTALSYLRSGMDAKMAAEAIYVHRNTFSYRLNKFVEITGIDPRDYHNALLIEVYEAFAHRS